MIWLQYEFMTLCIFDFRFFLVVFWGQKIPGGPTGQRPDLGHDPNNARNQTRLPRNLGVSSLHIFFLRFFKKRMFHLSTGLGLGKQTVLGFFTSVNTVCIRKPIRIIRFTHIIAFNIAKYEWFRIPYGSTTAQVFGVSMGSSDGAETFLRSRCGSGARADVARDSRLGEQYCLARAFPLVFLC